VIVVIGSPAGRLQDAEVVAAGTAARVALAAASAGRKVQVVGRTGDDAAADGLLLTLTRGGVGHVALLRDPVARTLIEPDLAVEDTAPSSSDEAEMPPQPSERGTLDAADVELGLRYLTEFAVLVLAEPTSADVVRVVADAAGWNGAQLLMVVDAGADVDGFPPDAIVFEAPADDRDGAFASLVGTFAAALDDGGIPGDAFRSSVEAEGWAEATPD